MGNSSQKSVTADSIASAAASIGKKGPAPVHLWNPPFCGDLDMRIARDGTWFYLGTPIGRKPLVKLFSSVLRKDGDDYFLVTPVEKVGITVEDAPFVAVSFDVSGQATKQGITFTNNVGDTFTAGPDNPIRVNLANDGEPSPYVRVRTNLDALIDRKSFYRLVDLGVLGKVDGENWFGVWSGGQFFAFIKADRLGL